MNKLSLKMLEFIGWGILYITALTFTILVGTVAVVGLNHFLRIFQISPITEINFMGGKSPVPQMVNGELQYPTPTPEK